MTRGLPESRLLWKIKERVREKQIQKLKLQQSSADLFSHVTEGTLQQKLDHFNKQDTSFFTQRFLVNEKFWQRPNGPVFLFVGGEGPISVYDVVAGHHVDLAKHHGALLLALEHRFYGDSTTPDALQIESLVHLSSQQALTDLVVFHQFISSKFSLSSRNTWISFGGSYSGALSAWFRGKFPHLVFGAVASSAPVKAKLDFSEYNQIVGLSLKNENIGGSVKCFAEVQKAFSILETELMFGNSTRVGQDFNCCQDLTNMDDKRELVQSLADIFMGTVQYNEEVWLMSVREVCDLMTNSSDAQSSYDQLIKLAQVHFSIFHSPCVDVSHEAAVRDLMDTSERSGRRGERQWMYQTCSEFGFYQTCEDCSCPFSAMLTLDSYTRLCTEVFGISQNSLLSHIAFTNAFYGADDPRTFRVLYVNGGVDPWQALSVVQDGTEERGETVFIQDTAHCADMLNSRPTDRRSLTEARQEIARLVSSWLKMAALSST
ncbi:hypothetical protein WMY93_028958 [Mugilogobius chulae]|uniref:Thymus-specific serine protease n=1 Tax=Mugilogobius chulae TaxID=88201 RepID=A0AAW0MYW8_9GOBI